MNKFNWLRGLDLNQGPSGYEPDELPDCSTPRLIQTCYITIKLLSKSIVNNILLNIGDTEFIGSNLTELLSSKIKFNIISCDNYSGSIRNYIASKIVKYIKGFTKNIKNRINKYVNNVNAIFHFVNYSRYAKVS